MRKWFTFQNAADDPTSIDIHIIDIIGDWIDQMLNEAWGETVTVTAKAFVEQLAAIPAAIKTIRLHVNSPGGDVFAAVNMANALRDQRLSKGRTVDVYIDGLAASAASIVIMAGDTIRIGDNALVMVHNPYPFAIGTATELRQAADEIDKIRGTIVATYQWQSKLSTDELIALMDATTWMDASEAVANGFATEVVSGLKAAAALDPRALGKLTVPERFKARVDALLAPPAAPPTPPAPQPAAAADVLRLCREGGCLDLAEGLLSASATLEDVQGKVGAEKAARIRAAARATQIRAICDHAKLPELADGYISGGMTLEAVQAQLTTLTAKLDAVEIDGSLSPDKGGTRKARIDTSAVYAERNRVSK